MLSFVLQLWQWFMVSQLPVDSMVCPHPLLQNHSSIIDLCDLVTVGKVAGEALFSKLFSPAVKRQHTS